MSQRPNVNKNKSIDMDQLSPKVKPKERLNLSSAGKVNTMSIFEASKRPIGSMNLAMSQSSL
jgi:hypothetical protein